MAESLGYDVKQMIISLGSSVSKANIALMLRQEILMQYAKPISGVSQPTTGNKYSFVAYSRGELQSTVTNDGGSSKVNNNTASSLTTAEKIKKQLISSLEKQMLNNPGDKEELEMHLDFLKKKLEEPGEVYALACATSGANAGGLSQAEKEANAKYIYSYLTDKDWTKEAIAGLLGNIEQESRMNPGAWEVYNQTTTLRSGYGLVQWTISGEKFLRDAHLTAKEANDLATNNPKQLMDLQLEYLQDTMKPGGGEWLTGGVDKYYAKRPLDYATSGKMTYAEFISSTNDPGDLALVFHASYERSGDGKAILDDRVEYANTWYQFINK